MCEEFWGWNCFVTLMVINPTTEKEGAFCSYLYLQGFPFELSFKGFDARLKFDLKEIGNFKDI